MPIAQHPEIAIVIVEGPQGFRFDRSLRKGQDFGTNLALRLLCVRPMNESWRSKGEKQSVLVEKIERYQSLALPQIVGSRGIKAERLNWNRERRPPGRRTILLRRASRLTFSMAQRQHAVRSRRTPEKKR